MVRIALGLEYDGSRFCGWQCQADGCGVQDALEAALAKIAGEPLRSVTAGRTDAGVHALWQVVHFDTAAARPLSAWVRGVNSELPAGVAVLWAREVSPGFHARFSAYERAYCYVLLNHPVRPALLAGKAGWFHLPLDADAMAAAAQILVGKHDFSAFRAADCQAKSPVKELLRARVARRGPFLVFDFAGNAFLHHMIRNIVGCLVYVGKGAHPPGWLRELLQAKDRRLAAPTFAPDGLYFAGPRYEPHWGVPEPAPRGLLLAGLEEVVA